MSSFTEKNSCCEYDDNIEVLRGIPHFSELPIEFLKVMALVCDRINYQAGSDIVSQGDNDSNAYFVVEGEVEVLRRAEDGKQVVYDTYGPGAFFGAMALMTDVKRLFSVRAKGSVRILVMARRNLVQDLAKTEHGLDNFLKAVSRTIVDWEESALRSMDGADEIPCGFGVSLL